MKQYGHYIDGREVQPANAVYFPSQDPFTGEAWAQVACGSKHDVDRAVAAARSAFENPAWRDLTATQRGQLLRALAELVREHAPRLAQIEQRDNGKLLAEVQAQALYVSEYFHYYAGLADKIQSQVIPSDRQGVFAYTRFEPKG